MKRNVFKPPKVSSESRLLAGQLKQAMRTPKVRYKDGVARTVRDGYGTATDWFALVAAVRKRDNGQCVYCSSKKALDTHHTTPLSRGGTTTLSNLVTVCKTCHARRHSHL